MSDLLPRNDATSTPDRDFFEASAEDFIQIPGLPIVYWLSDAMRKSFTMGEPLGNTAQLKNGMSTGNNESMLREWYEVSADRFTTDCKDRLQVFDTGMAWFPYNKGGKYRKWYGNAGTVIRYDLLGQERMASLVGSRPNSPRLYFKKCLSWSKISSGEPAFRFFPEGFVFDVAGCSLFPINEQQLIPDLAILNSTFTVMLLAALSPTLNFEAGQLESLPSLSLECLEVRVNVEDLIQVSRLDWDSYETSWNFKMQPILKLLKNDSGKELSGDAERQSLEGTVNSVIKNCEIVATEQQQREIRNNELVADAYGVRDEVPSDVPIERVSLKSNPAFRYPKNTPTERDTLFARDIIKEIISYALGCMFGRYSLDKPGLILASQGETLDDYFAQIPKPSFEPDKDNVIPVTEVDCFEDDIVSRFRRFLEITFGKENLAENIAYIQSVLGKDLRKYFVSDFYNDHVKMYKNRPIYWQYSSRTDNKGSFKALVYLHRYTPKTNGTVLGYLRDYTSRIAGIAEQLEKSDRTQDKRASEKLHKAVAECKAYEDQTLYPLATRNLEIDLDDGVLVNYLRLGKALRKIPAIEKKRKDVESWTWPHYQLKH